MTVLQRSELVAEYVSLAERVAQDGPPVAGGQQPFDRGIRRTARELSFLGKTEHARRKIVSRALAIAGMSAEAKTAVSAAGLENQQGALLAIANEPTPLAQTQKANEIVTRKRLPRSSGRNHREKRLETEIEILQAEGKERRATIDSLKLTITNLQAQLIKCAQSECQATETAGANWQASPGQTFDYPELPEELDRRKRAELADDQTAFAALESAWLRASTAVQNRFLGEKNRSVGSTSDA